VVEAEADEPFRGPTPADRYEGPLWVGQWDADQHHEGERAPVERQDRLERNDYRRIVAGAGASVTSSYEGLHIL
jgi:hypothetical protein